MTVGVIVTLTPVGGGPAAVTVIVADADFVPSLTDVAVSVTVAGLGTVAGPVYVTAVPDALLVGDTAPHAPAVAHDAAHVTPFAALSLLTVAVKLCVPLAATDAVAGATVTVIPGIVVPPSPAVLDVPPHPPKTTIPAAEIAAANKIPPTRCARTRIT
jgi:hypothetical protein